MSSVFEVVGHYHKGIGKLIMPANGRMRELHYFPYDTVPSTSRLLLIWTSIEYMQMSKLYILAILCFFVVHLVKFGM